MRETNYERPTITRQDNGDHREGLHRSDHRGGGLMDRRVSIIRFWLLAAFSACVTLAMPTLAVGLWPVLFLFPGCVCCGGPDEDCPMCLRDTVPAQVQAIINGVANSSCLSCTNLNTTWTLTFSSGDTSGCQYRTAGTTCGILNPAVFITQSSSDPTARRLECLFGNGIASYISWALTLDPGTNVTTCEEIDETLPFDGESSGPFFDDCNGGASTCQVVSL